jgi:hypothetical protein
MFTVTRDWLFANRQPSGMWSIAQMEALGFSGGVPPDWIDRIVGQSIPEDAASRFEGKANSFEPYKAESNPTAWAERRSRYRSRTKPGKRKPSPTRDRVWFGKHKGERWSVVPVGYLRWCLDAINEPAIKAACRLELKRRRSGDVAVTPAVEDVDGPIADEFIRDSHPVGLAPWEPLDAEYAAIVGGGEWSRLPSVERFAGVS